MKGKAKVVVLSCALMSLAYGPGVARADVPATPSPDDVEAARVHYKRGVQLYDEGRYEPALVELERANALSPTYKLLYNIALVQTRLGDFAGALRSFEAYRSAVTQGRASIPPARRAEVERFVQELAHKVVTVTITANVDGAEITVDDRDVGATPLAGPLRVNPGPHRVTAHKADLRESKEIDLAGGEHLDLPFTLTAAAPEPAPPIAAPEPALPPPSSRPEIVAAPAPAPEPPPPAPTIEARRAPTWIGWTATGALAAGALATGIAALVKSHELSEQVSDQPTSAGAIHATHDSTVKLALVSDILGGAALAAAGVTLYVTLTSQKKPVASSAHAEVRAGLGGVTLRGTF